ncbi:MAG: RluA family pseudouridine synthase [Saprospiraceae bacterium]|nr:RluA family pseudouridine synthase [Saprospiraceae bacterium]
MNKHQVSVIFENDYLLAINKPSGLLSIPDRYDKTLPCAYHFLKEKHEQIFILHRLDKDTSGILLFAKDPETHQTVNGMFEHQEIEKTYQCITEAYPVDNEGMIDMPIAHDPSHPGRMTVHPKGKTCITKFLVLQRFKHFGHIQVSPKTGRTHQIRVHFAFIGSPLVCDPLYGIRKTLGIQDIKRKAKRIDIEEASYLLQRTALHASQLSFVLNGENYLLQAPMPKDMNAALKQIEKWDK